jgi:hypothetical protein
MIQNLLKQAESGEDISSISLPDSMKSQERAEKIFNKFKDGKVPPISDKMDAKNAFSFALEIEKQSFDHYSRAAADADDNETRAVYQFLAGEENKHYNIINNAMDFIDDPGRWLYQEENLVFRRG